MVRAVLIAAIALPGCVVFDSFEWEPSSSTELPDSFGTTQRPDADDPCRSAARALCSDDGSVRLTCANGFPELEVCPNGCVNGRCRDLCINEGDIECNEARSEVTQCGDAFASTTLAPCADSDTCALGACRPLDETCDATVPSSCTADQTGLRLCDPLGGAIEAKVRCAEGVQCVTLFQDWDGDGIGADAVAVCGEPAGVAEDFDLVVRGGDCDDSSSSISPDVEETPGDEIDQNCDGSEDCFQNSDGDGYRSQFPRTFASSDTDCQDEGEAPAGLPAGDCDDDRDDINPGAIEIPGDGVDQNCDQMEECYSDLDEDGYRTDDPAALTEDSDEDCRDEGEAPATAPAGDCDDTRADAFPGAIEIAGDGVDQDCDDRELCVLDEDGDGVPEGWPPVSSRDLTCAEHAGIFEPNTWDCAPDSGASSCPDDGDWVLVPALLARLGSTAEDRFHSPLTEPFREVEFSHPFAMSATEVTQAQWLQVFPANPSEQFACGDCPVERVNWFEAVAYANERSDMAGYEPCYELVCDGTPGDALFSCSTVAFVGFECEGYRLPSDAEWEHAARAGTRTQIYTGSVEMEPRSNVATDELQRIAVRGESTSVVGSLEPNAWGLYDMSGNVFEWTFDGFTDSAPGAGRDPVVPSGANRSLRGGGFDSALGQLRSAARTFAPATSVNRNRGFRLVRSVLRPE